MLKISNLFCRSRTFPMLQKLFLAADCQKLYHQKIVIPQLLVLTLGEDVDY